MLARTRWLVLAAVAVAGALATPAGAATYCVSDPACVTAGGIARADPQSALDAAKANAGPDTVKLGAGTFSAANGFDARDASDAIAVVGAGRGVTTLAATTAGRSVLDFGASRDATVSDLSVAMPPSGGVGVFVPQHIARVTISGGLGAATGLWTQNTSVDDVSIQLPLDTSDNTGLYRPNGTLTADGLSITAHRAINGFGTHILRHVRIVSDGTGIVLGSSIGSTSTIDDAQIRMTGSGIGLQWTASFGSPAILAVRFLTIPGDGTSGSVGVDSHGSNAGSVANLTLESSIVAGFDHALSCSVASSGAASFTARYSAFDPGDLVQGCATAIDTATGNIASDPLLQLLPNGDLLLAAGSPAIDAGDPAQTAPSPATDLAGNARLLDGNGDGTARVDMGAFEGAPPPPPIAPPPVGERSVPRPVVKAFLVAPRRFAPLLARPLARARAGRRGPRRGALFTYALSAPAAVSIAIEQLVPGRRAGRGRACRTGARARGRRCTRVVRHVTLRQAASSAVRRSLAFSGRVRGHALPPGSYRATIVARVDGALDSLPRSVRFTLLP